MEVERIFRKMMRSRFMEEARELISRGKVIADADLQSWGEFFDDLQVPRKLDKDILQKRATINILYYRVNYVFLAFGLLAVSAVLWNGGLAVVAPVAALQAYCLFHYRSRNFPIVIQGHQFSLKYKGIALGLGVAVSALIVGAFWATFSYVLMVVCCIASHALTRPKSKRSNFKSLGKSVTDMEAGSMENDEVQIRNAAYIARRKQVLVPNRLSTLPSTTMTFVASNATAPFDADNLEREVPVNISSSSVSKPLAKPAALQAPTYKKPSANKQD